MSLPKTHISKPKAHGFHMFPPFVAAPHRFLTSRRDERLRGERGRDLLHADFPGDVPTAAGSHHDDLQHHDEALWLQDRTIKSSYHLVMTNT
jgi:hypothetical protein